MVENEANPGQALTVAGREQARTEIASAKQLAEWVPSLSVHDQISLEYAAGQLLPAVKAAWEATDTKRRSFTGPLTNVVRALNAEFAPALKFWTEAEQAIKSKIAAYRQAVDSTRRTEAEAGLPVLLSPVEAEGVSFRTLRKFEIKNPDEVPRQFCSPDPDKIREHLRNGGLEAIKGVRFYDETQVVARKVKPGAGDEP